MAIAASLRRRGTELGLQAVLADKPFISFVKGPLLPARAKSDQTSRTV
jgi:hypothetical protein